MTDYYGKAIADFADTDGVTTWAWADHDGFHCGATPPPARVPTGHIWGWGAGVWAHLRTDPHAPTVGIVVRDHPFEGSTKVQAIAASHAHPVHEDRFLQGATEADELALKTLSPFVLALNAPTHAVLVAAQPDRS